MVQLQHDISWMIASENVNQLCWNFYGEGEQRKILETKNLSLRSIWSAKGKPMKTPMFHDDVSIQIPFPFPADSGH